MLGDGRNGDQGDLPGTQPSPPPDWWIYRGTGQVMPTAERDAKWPKPPPWRSFRGAPDLVAPELDEHEAERRLGRAQAARSTDRAVLDRVNAAVALARPILVTGRPGSGKSSLAHSIAKELGLGRVLRWPISSRTTLKSGLWDYDSFGRAQAIGLNENSSIGNFVHLGPLGTAFLPYRLPRVLLIDEIDKSDVDLPNDLLNVFEEGEFSIPELIRVRDREREVVVHTADTGRTAAVTNGVVQCNAFPLVVITSNGERDFPPAFLRRCITLNIPDPDPKRLSEMVLAHFPNSDRELTEQLVRIFSDRSKNNDGLAADQLLNAIHLVRPALKGQVDETTWRDLLDSIWHRLNSGS